MCQHKLAVDPVVRQQRGAFRVAMASAVGGPLSNDDVSRLVPHRSLAVICDGLESNRGNRIASQIAASTFVDTVLRAEGMGGIPLMEAAIAAADQVVCGASLVQEGKDSMRASLVGAFPFGEQVIVGTVGRSRAVLVSHEGVQVGVTHSAFDAVAGGAIGSSAAIGSIAAIRPRRDQVLVLCSDGLSALVDDGTLAMMTMWHYRRGDLANLAEHLVDAAVNRETGEAVTVVVAGLLNAAPREDTSPTPCLRLVPSDGPSADA